MRWTPRQDDWHQSFAWLPVTIGDVVVWLEPYWRRPSGYYEEVELFDPAKPATTAESAQGRRVTTKNPKVTP